MKYLFSVWQELKEQLSGKSVFLFLDYDGTLAPIADSPNQAVLSSETRGLLQGLRDCPRCKIAIISGRKLEDIRSRVGIEGIIYAGNHGLEIEGPKIRFRSLVTLGYLKILQRKKAELERGISPFVGAFIEDKGLILSLHCRQADKKDIQGLKLTFDKTVSVYSAKDKIRVKTGKMVFEIQPPVAWDKGKAALWLLARQSFALKGKPDVIPLYIGDDVTDEDAFKAFENRGITVCVGESAGSRAKYYLKNTEEVFMLLKEIKGLVS